MDIDCSKDRTSEDRTCLNRTSTLETVSSDFISPCYCFIVIYRHSETFTNLEATLPLNDELILVSL